MKTNPGLTWHAAVFCSLVCWVAAPTVAAAQEWLKVEGALLKAVYDVKVPTEVAGPIETIMVKPGDRVEKDQVIAQIRSKNVELKLSRSQIELKSATEKANSDIDRQYAQKSREVADKELERAENANEAVSRTISGLEIDRLKLVAERARLEILREDLKKIINQNSLGVFENDVEQARFLLNQFVIRSPISGRVTRIEKQAGEWVEPGTDFARVVDATLLRAEGLIPAAATNWQLIDQPAVIRVASGEGDFIELPGQVVFVGVDANPVSSLVQVWIEFENVNEQLSTGLRVEVSIDTRLDAKLPVERSAQRR